jgi:hypothetical protein
MEQILIFADRYLVFPREGNILWSPDRKGTV